MSLIKLILVGFLAVVCMCGMYACMYECMYVCMYVYMYVSEIKQVYMCYKNVHSICVKWHQTNLLDHPNSLEHRKFATRTDMSRPKPLLQQKPMSTYAGVLYIW